MLRCASQVVYRNRSSVFAELLGPGDEQWPDASWARLIHDSQAFILSDGNETMLPATNARVLVRQIDLMSNNSGGVWQSALARSKALVFQAAVGAGEVTACGMNVLPSGPAGRESDAGALASSWLLRRLLAEALGLPGAR